jgi:arylsulfatase A
MGLFQMGLDIPPYVYIDKDRVTATVIDTIEGTTGKGFWRRGPVGNDFLHEAVLPVLTEKTVAYIREHSKAAAPFFLYYAMPAPHTPILPTREFLGKSGTTAYGDFVMMVDDAVGKIIKAVKEAGIENNTFIIFTSDNGCSPTANFKELAGYDHNPSYVFRGAKADIYEGGHRIPFIVKWPGKVKPVSVCNTTICLTDLMATCAAIVNYQLPANAGEDSYSLLPLLLKNNKNKYSRTSTIHHSIDGDFAIRQDKWKLVFCAGSGGWSYPTKGEAAKQSLSAFQLYDMEKDIAETNNLIDKYPEVKERLTLQIEKIINSGRSTFGKNQQNDVPVILNK